MCDPSILHSKNQEHSLKKRDEISLVYVLLCYLSLCTGITSIVCYVVEAVVQQQPYAKVVLLRQLRTNGDYVRVHVCGHARVPSSTEAGRIQSKCFSQLEKHPAQSSSGMCYRSDTRIGPYTYHRKACVLPCQHAPPPRNVQANHLPKENLVMCMIPYLRRFSVSRPSVTVAICGQAIRDLGSLQTDIRGLLHLSISPRFVFCYFCYE